jgi:hypothetical protein
MPREFEPLIRIEPGKPVTVDYLQPTAPVAELHYSLERFVGPDIVTPKELDMVRLGIAARIDTQEDADFLRVLAIQGKIGAPTASLLLGREPKPNLATALNIAIDEYLRHPDVMRQARLDHQWRGNEYATTPRIPLRLSTHGWKDTDGLRAKIAAAGAGPASIFLLRTLKEAGIGIEGSRMFDPRGVPGGIWQDDFAAKYRYNNPEIDIYGVRWEDNDRRASQVAGKLAAVAGPDIVNMTRQGVVERVEASNGKFVVHVDSSMGRYQDTSDFFLIATGNGKPRPIESSRIPIEVNKPQILDRILRYQKTYTREEALALDGKSVIVMAGGNSMTTIADEIDRCNREYGTRITFIAVSDETKDLVHHPDLYGRSRDGSIKKFSRSGPDGSYTPLVRDVPEYSEIYDRILEPKPHPVGSDRRLREAYPKGLPSILPDWNGIQINDIDEDGRTRTEARISTAEGALTLRDVGQIFFLPGYQNDVEQMERLGAKVIDPRKGFLDINDEDGAVNTTLPDMPANRMYALGGAAVTRDRSQKRVMPSMVFEVPKTAFSIWVALQRQRLYGQTG